MDSFSTLRLPYNQLITIRVPVIAVNMDDKIPIISVTAKPLMEPVPKANNTTATTRLVKWESRMVAKALS